MSLFLAAIALLSSPPAAAKQVKYSVDKGSSRYSFDVEWRDDAGEKDRVKYSLSTSKIKRDLQYKTFFPIREANKFIVGEVKSWAKDNAPKGVKIQVKAQGGGIGIGATGPSKAKVKKGLAGATKARDRALDRYLADNDFIKMGKKDAISFDHAGLVDQYVDDLMPLADALHEGTTTRREYLDRALHFVETIPYEKLKRNGQNAGYRRPVALLARNRGDCDSKAVLYLALARAKYPELPAAVVYIPGHAFVGVGVKPTDDTITFEASGRTFVMAEPVGPAVVDLGRGGKKSQKRAKRGKIEVRTVP